MFGNRCLGHVPLHVSPLPRHTFSCESSSPQGVRIAHRPRWPDIPADPRARGTPPSARGSSAARRLGASARPGPRADADAGPHPGSGPVPDNDDAATRSGGEAETAGRCEAEADLDTRVARRGDRGRAGQGVARSQQGRGTRTAQPQSAGRSRRERREASGSRSHRRPDAAGHRRRRPADLGGGRAPAVGARLDARDPGRCRPRAAGRPAPDGPQGRRVLAGRSSRS